MKISKLRSPSSTLVEMNAKVSPILKSKGAIAAKNEKVINYSQDVHKHRESDENEVNKSLSPVEKRLEAMNTYLKSVFFTISLNQTNLDGVIAIYELMK
jgi:hypothetical protein